MKRLMLFFFCIPLFGFYKNYVPRFTRCIVPQAPIKHIRTFSVGNPPQSHKLSEHRKLELECTTNLLSLFAIHSLHHMKVCHYPRYYNLHPLEQDYLKECVDRRYKSHQTYLEAVYGLIETH